MKIGVADIKSLYTNINHNLGLKAIQFWLNQLKNKIPLLKRFPKNFIMEGLFIVLNFNYFYINGIYLHQLRGTAMGTPAAVIYANLTVAYIESKMFEKLPEIYPQDVVTFFLQNYFRFLDDVFFKWKYDFDISLLYRLFESMDPNIKFIFEELSSTQHFLDVKCTMDDGEIKFDMHYKPTNSFTYLRFDSCHPQHTINNVAYSLARRIVNIVTTNKDIHIDKLLKDLEYRKHPTGIVNISLSKLFSPKNETQEINKDLLTFVHTYNPRHDLSTKKVLNSVKNIKDTKLKDAFKHKNIIATTRNSKNLKQLLTRAKFEMYPIIKSIIPNGLYACKDNKCLLHTKGYITTCT